MSGNNMEDLRTCESFPQGVPDQAGCSTHNIRPTAPNSVVDQAVKTWSQPELWGRVGSRRVRRQHPVTPSSSSPDVHLYQDDRASDGPHP